MTEARISRQADGLHAMSDHKYKITYKIDHHPEGLSREQLAEMEDVGACDNIILILVMGTPGNNEALSTVIVSRTGDGDAELTPNQMFTLWSVWTSGLANEEELSPGKRSICTASAARICSKAAIWRGEGRDCKRICR